MTNVTYGETNLDAVGVLPKEYLDSLTCVVDDFWEEHIVKARMYSIYLGDEEAGFFTIYDGEKLTLFYLRAKYWKVSQKIFGGILCDFEVKTAYVTTGDQLFLSLCMDFHKKVCLQAYFFDGTERHDVRTPEYERADISEIDYGMIAEINRKTGNFFDFVNEDYFKENDAKIYLLSKGGIELGYGIIVRNRFTPSYYACGMVTLPEHRRKGVGRSLQIHMADMVRECGGIPISGCWYYNELSKKTIESAGRFSKTRLLNVWFVEDETEGSR